MNDFIFMNDVSAATEFLNQLTDTESKQTHILPSGGELRINKKDIFVVPKYNRDYSPKNINCIFKFIETHKWKILQYDNGNHCTTQNCFTQIIDQTIQQIFADISKQYKSPFYFQVTTTIYGNITISLSNDKPYITLLYHFHL